jgi:hypothetical protein
LVAPSSFKALILLAPISDSGNDLRTSILTGAKNLIQVLHNHFCLSASSSKVLSRWFLPLSM